MGIDDIPLGALAQSGAKTYKYNVTSTSQIHATDTNSSGGKRISMRQLPPVRMKEVRLPSR
jgi:hypothetical protein